MLPLRIDKIVVQETCLRGLLFIRSLKVIKKVILLYGGSERVFILRLEVADSQRTPPLGIDKIVVLRLISIVFLYSLLRTVVELLL